MTSTASSVHAGLRKRCLVRDGRAKAKRSMRRVRKRRPSGVSDTAISTRLGGSLHPPTTYMRADRLQALALPGDTAEGRAVLVDADRLDGALPRASLHLLAGAAIQVARATVPAALRTCQGAGPRRPLPPCRWVVGRERLEHAQRRSSRAAVHLRPTLLREQVWLPLRHSVAAGFVWLDGRVATADSSGRYEVLFHAEIELVSSLAHELSFESRLMSTFRNNM